MESIPQERPPSPSWWTGGRLSPGRWVVASLAIAVVVVTLLGAFAPSGGAPSRSLLVHTGSAAPLVVAASAAPARAALGLGVTVTPGTICAYGLNTCAAGNGIGRLTLTADAGSSGIIAWPNVQVAFVMETTLYDGVYDPTAGEPGGDPCALANGGQGQPCEESNGVNFFQVHAQQIANAIAAANPHSHVSFALVDYFATCNFDDCDGAEYHVDIQNFVPASNFGTEVQSTFTAEVLGGGFYYFDSDFSDNFLHSSVITAMYGTIIGSGLSWSPDTHHVIVWMGSTAPRDPNYLENYCVSPSTMAGYYTGSACYGSTCEPSYSFGAAGVSPNCEGWVKSQDGNQTHSIAMLAKTAPSCTESIGGVCTVDTIDYWTTPTDPYSKGWPTGRQGGGPGGTIVQQNVNHVLLAGCDMAAATGGTWNGPSYFTCPNGVTGSLTYVNHGPYNKPDTDNPSLLAALRQVGFGPVLQTQVASGSNRPIFTYVPFGNIALAPDLQATASCLRAGTALHTCQTVPQVLHSNGVTFLGWNWSTNKTNNVMYIGDYWSASFNIIATGPPFTTVPVDACITTLCHAGGSGAVAGLYTSASFVPYTNNSVVTLSFPLATINVQFTPPATAPPAAPPPPPPPPPPFPIIAPQPVGIPQSIGIGNNVGVGNVSLQAAAAGFLGAGFLRVTVKNRPIAMKIAAKSGVVTSKFDKGLTSMDGGVGKFE